MIPLTNNGLSLTQLTSIYYLEAKTELLKTFRYAGFVLPSLLFPVMFYCFFGVLFASPENNNTSTYLMATYVAFGAMGPALFSFGAILSMEKDKGLLELKQISPMPIMAYFSAKTVTSMVFAFLIVLLLFSVAITLAGVKLSGRQWLATFATVLPCVLPFCFIGMYIGLKVKSQAATAVINLLYLPLSFLSGLWIPVYQLPELLQKFAWLLPPFHFSQLLLKILDKDIGSPWWLHVMVLALYSVVFALLARHAFKNMEKR